MTGKALRDFCVRLLGRLTVVFCLVLPAGAVGEAETMSILNQSSGVNDGILIIALLCALTAAWLFWYCREKWKRMKGNRHHRHQRYS